jgi:small GTP-binding protein
MSKNYDYSIKLLMIGDSNVGKTSILTKYVNNQFSNTFITTIGIDFKIKYIKVNNKNIKLQLWDTAGQERFRSITISYFRGAQGAIITYDATDRSTFDNVKKWMDDINKQCSKNIDVFLVANKIDLEKYRVVSKEEGEELAKKYKILYFECSAKTGENIENLYFNIATIISKKIIEKDPKINIIKLNNEAVAEVNAEIKKSQIKWSC